MPVLEKPLSEIEIDALREVANIGAGHAVTSLAAMTGHTFGMTVPAFGVKGLDQFGDVLGDPEALAVGVYMPVCGDVEGHAAFLFPYANTCHLADFLLGQPSGTTVALDEMEASAILELGNVIVSSFLNAMSEMTGLSLPSGVPSLAVDMTGAILGSIAAASPDLGDHSLTIMTRFSERDHPVKGVFVFIPEPGSLVTLFAVLGL